MSLFDFCLTITDEDLGDVEKDNVWEEADTESEEEAQAYGRAVEIQVPFRETPWVS